MPAPAARAEPGPAGTRGRSQAGVGFYGSSRRFVDSSTRFVSTFTPRTSGGSRGERPPPSAVPCGSAVHSTGGTEAWKQNTGGGTLKHGQRFIYTIKSSGTCAE